MKKIFPDKIINIENTDIFDNKFLFDYLECDYNSNSAVEVIYLSDLLESKKNSEMLEKAKLKPAMYSNVYSPKDELEIFTELFENAIKNNKKVHIVWITLDAEIKILEEYYTKLGFMREDINCFSPDFQIPLVTASVKIENIMWKGSDYKAQKSNIYFNPPVRESWEVKAMFKWINRGVTAGIYISEKTPEIELFLSEQIKTEKILPLAIAKLLKYNLESIWFTWKDTELIVEY
jgi:hypothetical protein